MNEEIIIIQDEKVQEIDTIKESVKYIEPITQEKKVVPTKQRQEVVADDGFTSLSKVIVESIPNNYQEVKGEVLLKTNGVHNVAPYETAKVEFEVKLQERSASAVTSGDLIVEPSEGYDGMSKVIINKVTSSIDPDIKSENIRQGINILGVEGSYEGSPILQEKTITPSDKQQNVFPDSEYNGLSKVVVEPIPSDYIKPTGTLLVDENGSYDVKNYANVEVDVESSGGTEKTYFAKLNKTGNSSKGGILASIYMVPDNVAITVGKFQFAYCSSLVKAPKLDYSNLTDCQYMFYYCSSMKDSTGLVNFKKITSAYNMFGYSALTNIDMSGWDFTNLTETYNMFVDCQLLEIDINNKTSSKLTNMTGMFSSCQKMVNANLKNCSFTACTKVSSMFSNCSVLTNVNFDGSNFTKCNNFTSMFNNCKVITNIDLSAFHYASSITTQKMFYGCVELQHVDLRNLDISKSTSYTDMFYNVPTNCEIIVMNDACKTWMNEKFPTMTNVKTVAELG